MPGPGEKVVSRTSTAALHELACGPESQVRLHTPEVGGTKKGFLMVSSDHTERQPIPLRLWLFFSPSDCPQEETSVWC